ncbi:hypothetical protein EDB89DRAFT_1986236 [Lactarius sanguifluus]|nr:hypothetical protein EDB89DRAFT_1986236 [Lactarius sanguifluus]
MVPQRAGLSGAWCHAAIVGPSRPRDQELACLLMVCTLVTGPVFPNTARRITIWILEDIDILSRYLPTQLPTQTTWWIIYCILGVPRYSTARVQTFNLKMRNSGDKKCGHLRHVTTTAEPTQTRCYITCDCGSAIGQPTAGYSWLRGSGFGSGFGSGSRGHFL